MSSFRAENTRRFAKCYDQKRIIKAVDNKRGLYPVGNACVSCFLSSDLINNSTAAEREFFQLKERFLSRD